MNGIAKRAMSSSRHASKRIALVDRFLEKTRPPRGGAALEIGCGAGFVSAHLAQTYGMKVEATDADPQMLELARRKSGAAGGVTFTEADAGALPFANGVFDLVVAQNVFHHVADWGKVADEVARVLKPGGMFLFSDISGPSSSMKFFSGAKESHGFHHVPELVDRMAENGIEVEHGDLPGATREFAMLFRRSGTS